MTRSGTQVMALLSQFGRHSPNILRKQLLCRLLEEYLGLHNISDSSHSFSSEKGVQHECRPSFERFHGTILFVDISGFTALSLKLNVEELKKHINEYFTMMLDIVDKHGGEVIKFAGDAIYIIWQTPLPQHLLGHDVEISEMAKLTSKNFSHDRAGIVVHKSSPYLKSCLEKAVMCGLEISAVCSNHRVVLDPALNPDTTFNANASMGKSMPGWSFLRGKVLPVEGEVTSTASTAAPAAASNEANVTYLNVHSGISNGLMAGIDVGANDRWEYLLIGKPLARVANAESQAGTGQLVLCPFSHDALHPPRPVASSPARGPGNAAMLKRGMSISKIGHGHAGGAGGTQSAEGSPSQVASLVGQAAADGSQLCACGCTRTAKGYFIVPARSDIRSGVDQAKLKRLRNISTNMQDLVLVANENIKIGGRIVQSVEEDISVLRKATQLEFRKTAVQIISRNEFHESLEKLYEKTGASNQEELVEYMLNRDDLNVHMMKFMHNCLLDDVAAHVHDVARNEFFLDSMYRHEAFEQYMQKTVMSMLSSFKALKDTLELALDSNQNTDTLDLDLGATLTSSPPTSPMNSTTGSVMSPIAARLLGMTSPTGDARNPMSPGQLSSLLESSTPFEDNDTFDENLPAKLTKKKRKNSTHSTQGSLATMIRKSSTKRISSGNEKVEMTAELRSVIVMFIKIDSIQMNLWVDSSADGANHIKYAPAAMNCNFLPRTPKEKRADELLLSRLQKCMQVVTSALAKNGGQLRQFIVDDKGTVAIGTFGLKGANVAINDDNAAAAIECARMIITNLQKFNIASSIGVTSGQGYCGLVGSLARHEYAIMGPSTNLSARLMSKAQSGQIMCDIELKKRDRTHEFEFISEIVAKGYVNKVSTFTPVFHQGTVETENDQFDSILGDIDGYTAVAPNIIDRASFSGPTGSKSDDSDSLGNFDSMDASSGIFSSEHEHPLVRILTQSEFYFRSKGSAREPSSNKSQGGSARVANNEGCASHQVLHGRHDEIKQILTYLFPTLRAASRMVYASASIRNSLKNNGSIKYSSMKSIETRRSGQYSPIFHHNTKPKMITISAAEGLGKSALLSSIGRKLFWLSKQSPNFNIALFRNRPASFQQYVPFLCWKPILQEMLFRARFESILMDNLSSETYVFDEGGQQYQSSDILVGLSKLLAMLPPSLQNLRPLLASAGIIDDEPDNEHTAQLTNQVKLSLTADLIAALIMQYPAMTKCCLLIIIEQIQWMDTSSLTVLHKIWSKGSGIAILSSIRPLAVTGTEVSTISAASPIDRSLARRSSAKLRPSSQGAHAAQIAGGAVSTEDPLRLFRQSERFRLLELANLDMESTKALIFDIMRSHGIELEDGAVDHIYEITGGNLLYTYEVTRSIQSGNIAKMDKDEIAETIGALRCNRVEEVIYHRFDQMNSASQFLMKAASVAAANGAIFNFALLRHLMERGGEYVASDAPQAVLSNDEGLVLTLYEILQSGEFLNIQKDDQDLNFNPEKEGVSFYETSPMLNRSKHDLDNMDLTKCFFSFAVRLEQLTIYGMLLDDQKEYFHEKVASYHYNLSQNSGERVSSTQLCEEGFHWHKSCAWAAAMSCYLRASERLREIGDIHIQRNYLLTAYTMFRSMCDDAGFHKERILNMTQLEKLIVDTSDGENAPFVVGETDGRPKRHRSTSTVQAEAPDSENALLTIESIYQIFGGDSDDLNYGLKVHIRLVQLNLVLYENYSFTARVLDDALQILLQSKNPYILNSKHFMRSLFAVGPVAESSSFIDGMLGRDEDGHERRKESTSEKLFCLSNYSAYCFPIMSAYIQLNSWSPRCNADQLQRAQLICEEALDLATREETNIFTIQLRCQEIMLYLNQAKLTEAAQSFRLLSTMYISSKHHNKLIALFGTDCVVHTMCTIIQYLIMYGDIHHAVHVTDQQMHLLMQIKHTESLIAAVIPLCASLSMMCCHSTALQICNQHYGILNSLSESSDSFAVFYTWLCRRVIYDHITTQSTKPKPTFLREELEEVDVLLREPSLLDTEHFGGSIGSMQSQLTMLSNERNSQNNQDHHWSTPIDDFLLISGLTINSILADLCLLKLSEMLLHLPPATYEKNLEQQLEIEMYSKSMELFLIQSERKVTLITEKPPLIYTLNITFMCTRKHIILSKLKHRDYKLSNGKYASIDDAEAEVDHKMILKLSLDDDIQKNNSIPENEHPPNNDKTEQQQNISIPCNDDENENHSFHHSGSDESPELGLQGIGLPSSSSSFRRPNSNDAIDEELAIGTENIWQLLLQSEKIVKEKKLIFGLLCVGNAMKVLNKDNESKERGKKNIEKALQLLNKLLGKHSDRYQIKLMCMMHALTECL